MSSFWSRVGFRVEPISGVAADFGIRQVSAAGFGFFGGLWAARFDYSFGRFPYQLCLWGNDAFIYCPLSVVVASTDRALSLVESSSIGEVIVSLTLAVRYRRLMDWWEIIEDALTALLNVLVESAKAAKKHK